MFPGMRLKISLVKGTVKYSYAFNMVKFYGRHQLHVDYHRKKNVWLL